MKKALLRIVMTLIIVVIIGVSLAVPAYAIEKNPKKAIIILPGLLSCGLYDTATGEAVWDPFTELDLWFTNFIGRSGIPLDVIIDMITEECVSDQLTEILSNDYKGTAESLLNKMAMKEDGTSAVTTIAPVPYDADSRLKYGAMNAYTEMYNSLSERYGSAYEIVVFNYDFRLDNRDSAAKLEEFIAAQGYEEVVLVSHSNGGEIAACYLAKSQKNRDIVSTYISMDSPYLGALAALSTLEDPEAMIEGIKPMLERNPTFSFLAEALDIGFEYQFKPLINMWVVYQLLPSYELLKTQQYYSEWTDEIKDISGNISRTEVTKNQEALINIGGEDVYFESEQELWEFYCSRPWAKMSNGELRPAMAEWLDYRNAMYVTLDDGTRVHSTTLVNTEYYSGIGYTNATKINYVTAGNDIEYSYSSDFTDQGDGTVMLYSATAGVTDMERIHIVADCDHYDVAQRFNQFSDDMTYSLLDEKLSGWDKFVIWLRG